MTLIIFTSILVALSSLANAAVVEAIATYELPTERVDGSILDSKELKYLVIKYSNEDITGQHVVFIEDVTLSQTTFKFDSPPGQRVIKFEVFVEDVDGLQSEPVSIEKSVRVINKAPNKIKLFVIELN